MRCPRSIESNYLNARHGLSRGSHVPPPYRACATLPMSRGRFAQPRSSTKPSCVQAELRSNCRRRRTGSPQAGRCAAASRPSCKPCAIMSRSVERRSGPTQGAQRTDASPRRDAVPGQIDVSTLASGTTRSRVSAKCRLARTRIDHRHADRAMPFSRSMPADATMIASADVDAS